MKNSTQSISYKEQAPNEKIQQVAHVKVGTDSVVYSPESARNYLKHFGDKK